MVFQLNTEIICAIIAMAGTLLSAVVAWFVSRFTANKEVEKLKLIWQREDIVTSNDEFAGMIAAVSKFAHVSSKVNRAEAAAKVAAVRAKEHGALAEALDRLYHTIPAQDFYAIDSALTYVIEKKREIENHSYNTHSEQPNE